MFDGCLELSAVFYVLLVAIPLTAVAALFAFARVVDSANGDRMDVLGRLQAILYAIVVAALVLLAAFSSPLT